MSINQIQASLGLIGLALACWASGNMQGASTFFGGFAAYHIAGFVLSTAADWREWWLRRSIAKSARSIEPWRAK